MSIPISHSCLLLGLALSVHWPAAQANTAVPPIYEACFQAAAERYAVDSLMLKAIAKTESDYKPDVVNLGNANGSHDVGMMQINSYWFPKLERAGITVEDLKKPCVNIHVGAWILADNIRQHGNTWRAVGSYNAKSESKRALYVQKVQRNYRLLSQHPSTY